MSVRRDNYTMAFPHLSHPLFVRTFPPAFKIFALELCEAVICPSRTSGMPLPHHPRIFISPSKFFPSSPAVFKSSVVIASGSLPANVFNFSAKIAEIENGHCFLFRLIAKTALLRELQNEIALRRADTMARTGLLSFLAAARGRAALAAAPDALGFLLSDPE